MFKLNFINFLWFFKKPKNHLEDGIDRFSSWIGSSLMLIFCTIASAGFGLGNHYECMIPANYPYDWQFFIYSYCYVQPHFYADNSDGVLLPEIYYFPWLPYFFFGHALAFYLPKMFWKAFSGAICRLDLECILKEANLINKSCDENEKKERREALTKYMATTLGFASNRYASTYFLVSATALLFLFKKFLYVIVACIQFYAICHYIGQGNMYWGFEVLSHFLHENVYLPSRFFPLFTLCRAPIAKHGVFVVKTVRCLLGMNVIYEKLYVFTYFLLLGIIITSFISALYYTALFITPLRTKLIDNLLRFKKSLIPFEHVEVFTHDFLGADGFLSILLIKQNFGDEVAQDILKELWNHTNSFSLSFKKESSPKRKAPPLRTTTAIPNRYATILKIL